MVFQLIYGNKSLQVGNLMKQYLLNLQHDIKDLTAYLSLQNFEELDCYLINVKKNILEKKFQQQLISICEQADQNEQYTIKVNYQYDERVFSRSKKLIEKLLIYNDNYTKNLTKQFSKLDKLQYTQSQCFGQILQNKNSNYFDNIYQKFSKCLNSYSPSALQEYFNPMNLPLLNHQFIAVQQIVLNNGNILLADQPGLGKSLTAIAAVIVFQKPVLIIVPPLLVNHWEEQINNFINKFYEQIQLMQHVYPYEKDMFGKKTKKLIFSQQYQQMLDITPKQELQQKFNKNIFDAVLKIYNNQTFKLQIDELILLQKNKYHLVFIYDQITKMEHFKNIVNSLVNKYFVIVSVTELRKLFSENMIQPEQYFTIIDEVHEYKDPSAEKTKNLMQVISNSEQALLLSATPVLNDVGELYSIFKILKLDIPNFLFNQRYCKVDANDKYKRVSGILNDVELKHLLTTITIRRIQSISNKIPKIYRYVIHLNAQQSNIQTQNAMVAYQKATEDKQQAAYQQLEEFNKHQIPFIVLFMNLNNLDIFKEFPNSAQISGATSMQQRIAIIQQFQQGVFNCLFCTIDSIAVGLDITRARCIFWLQMEWTMSLFQQAEGRIRRLSSTYDRVYSVVLSNQNYWDTRIYNIINTKKRITEWVCGDSRENFVFNKLEQIQHLANLCNK